MKAEYFNDAKKLSHIPNIGPAMIRDFKMLGITEPKQLKHKTAFGLYTKLCKITKQKQNPCILDVFLMVEDYVGGAPGRSWFKYTAERKKKYPHV